MLNLVTARPAPGAYGESGPGVTHSTAARGAADGAQPPAKRRRISPAPETPGHATDASLQLPPSEVWREVSRLCQNLSRFAQERADLLDEREGLMLSTHSAKHTYGSAEEAQGDAEHLI